MFPFSRIKHICFNVQDIEEGEVVFTKILGVRSTGITAFPLDGQQGVVKNTFFHLEKGSIELAYHDLPKSWRDSPINTGPGFHHIAFEVQNFDEALSELARKGINPLPKFPLKTPLGRVAFFYPKQTGGILFELGEMKK
jgi:methylmalonyl-CoA epimerase